MYNFFYLFLLFLIYSFIGWIIDICDIVYKYKKVVNRGFLIGPVCPIYGFGVLLMIFLLKDYTDSPLALFILAIFIFMTLEYLTSYFMEKLFNARWWDYSDRKFNLNGRICLETTIPFGLGGLLIMYVVNPFFTKILDKIPHDIVIIVGIILFVIFVIDYIISIFVMGKVSNVTIDDIKDDTEEMNKRVREYLIKLSPLTKRLMDSFPNVRIKLKKKVNKKSQK